MYNSFASHHPYKTHNLTCNSPYLPQTYQTYDYSNNSYNNTKIMDDHRFERTKLQKPGFLIKQNSIYPQNNEANKIGSVLEYADLLVKPPSHRFYSQENEQQRIRVQGKNPFLQDSSLVFSKMNYLKRSTRTKLDTNPNLGVRSYEVLASQTNRQMGKQSKVQPYINTQPDELNSSRRQKQPIEDYIAKSILMRTGKKQINQGYKHQQIKEENSDQDMFFEKRASGMRQQPDRNKQKLSIVNKAISTIVKYRQNPPFVMHKGKKFMKIN